MSAKPDDRVRIEKPWGHEVIWTHTDRYVGKMIVIRAGQRLSLQYHKKKDEAIYVVQGHLRLHLANSEGRIEIHDLGPGESRRICVGRTHRFEAVSDVQLIEVSTPELDDVVRIDDDFGRAHEK